MTDAALARPTPEKLDVCRRALRWRFGPGAAAVMPSSTAPASLGVAGRRGTIHVIGSGNSTPSAVSPDESALLRFGHVDAALAKVGERHRTVLALAHGDAGAVATTGGLHPSRRWRAVAPLTSAATERGTAWAAERDRPVEGPTSRLAPEVQQVERLKGFREAGEHPVVDPKDRSWRWRVRRLRKACPPPADPPQASEAPAVTLPPWEQPPKKPKRRLTQQEADERAEAAEKRRDPWAGPPSVRWLHWMLDPESKPSRDDRAALTRAEAEASQLITAAEYAFAAVYHALLEDTPR